MIFVCNSFYTIQRKTRYSVPYVCCSDLALNKDFQRVFIYTEKTPEVRSREYNLNNLCSLLSATHQVYLL